MSAYKYIIESESKIWSKQQDKATVESEGWDLGIEDAEAVVNNYEMCYMSKIKENHSMRIF